MSPRGALRLFISASGVVLALLPQPALAHAEAVGSDPAPGSLLPVAPARVSVFFTQAVQPFGQGLRVIGPDGRRVEAGPVAARGSQLSVLVNASGEGSYTVAWQVIASDSHPSRGGFLFSVGHASRPPAAVPAASPAGPALEVGARWLHFAGFALGFGSVAFAVLVLASRRVERLAGAGVILLLLAEPLAVLAQATSLSPETAMAPGAWQDVLASPFGRLVGLRLAAALLLWALLGAGPRARLPILGVGAGLALVDAGGAHAQYALPAAAALAANAIHVGAVAVWIGGVAALLWSWPVERATLARFGRVALWALAVAVAAGAGIGASEIGSARNLLQTGFGAALLAKVAVVGLAILAAAAGRRRLELGAMALVLVVAGLLAALPPPAP